jgi:excisionase family DNA binding protein
MGSIFWRPSMGTRRDLLTVTELADALAVSVATIRRMTRDGQIPCIRVRSLVRYDLEAVLLTLGYQSSSSSSSRTTGLDGLGEP